MTKREIERARLAHAAVKTLAKQAAKRQVIKEIRARGDRVYDYSNRDLTLMAEQYVVDHPEIVAQARETAKALGYVA